jgi:hypothetical protein
LARRPGQAEKLTSEGCTASPPASVTNIPIVEFADSISFFSQPESISGLALVAKWKVIIAAACADRIRLAPSHEKILLPSQLLNDDDFQVRENQIVEIHRRAVVFQCAHELCRSVPPRRLAL